MDDSALATLADTNYFETFAALGSALGIPPLDTGGGVLCVSSGTPVAFFNVLFVTGPLAEPESALAEGIAFFDDQDLPFVLRVREGVDPNTERAAERLGLPYSDTVPGMAMYPLAMPPAMPEGLEIERVGPGRLPVFQEVMAAGFDMPLEIVRQLICDATLEIPGLDCYVGSVEGEPVATSSLAITGRTAGVYNVATLESHRRRGLGEAMTWHATREGARAGCDVTILQASEMGQPIYERMGYRLVAPYRTFHRPGY